MKKSIIVVTGMHRSGTSAMARAMPVFRCVLGNQLIAPQRDNPKGFWEDREVVELDDRLLELLDQDHLSVGIQNAVPPASAIEFERLRGRALALVQQRLSGVDCFAFKDPRTARLLWFWKDVFDRADVEISYVIMLRNPLSVAQSLLQRNDIDPTLALWLWYEHTLLALRDTAHERRVLVEFEELLRNPASVLDSVARVLRYDRIDQVRLDEYVSSFLDESLNHNRYARDELRACSFVPGAIADFYDFLVMQRWSVDEARFDEECGRFWRFYEDMRPTLGLVHRQWKERRELYRELSSTQKELNSTQRELISTQSISQSYLKSAMEEKRRLEELLEGQKIDRALVEAELRELYRSKSWQVTRPLRWLAKQIRAKDETAAVVEEVPVTASTPVAMDEAHTGELGAVIVAQDHYESVDRENNRGGRVLIVTPDLHGPIRNGGIGTAFGALAETLVARGFAVTVLYALGRHSEDRDIEHWITVYREKGIRLVPLPDPQAGKPVINAPMPRILAWRVDRWLREHDDEIDVVVSPEWMGLCFYALLARGQGLAHHGLRFLINTHSPESWAREGNFDLPRHVDDLDREFMEREVVRRADLVVSPSAYLLDWMRDRKWSLPDRVEVVPNLLDMDSMRPKQTHDRTTPLQPRRVVFFGRLEKRKGLELFIRALTLLPADIREKIREVVFLGKGIVRKGFDSSRYIEAETRGLGLPVVVLTDKNKDEALDYLDNEENIAVIASLRENSPYTVLECIERGIRFIASNVGGIPELLREDSRAQHLFETNPSALALALARGLQEPFSRARPQLSQAEIAELWTQLLTEQVLDARAERSEHQVSDADIAGQLTTPQQESVEPRPGHSPTPGVLVSVCLVHFDRPGLLQQALDSLRLQTFCNFEVILVDDGSRKVETHRYLDALEAEFTDRGWTIIRQANRYLGAARNRAAQAASGEFLLFMDDDNIAAPEELEVLVGAIRNSGADILTCVSMPFSGDNYPQTVEEIWVPLGGAVGPGVYRNVFGDANALWRKSVFDAVGGYTEDYGVGHEDWELFVKACVQGFRLEVVPEALFWYRVNKQGMLRSGDVTANSARNIRPYLVRYGDDLGIALAYALQLELDREASWKNEVWTGPRPTLRALWSIRKYTMNRHAWSRVRLSLRNRGIVGTLRKMVEIIK